MEEVTIRSERDVAHYVDDHPVSKSSWLIVMVALGGIFVDSYDFVSLGVGIPQIRAQFHLTPLQIGNITSMMSVGGLVGAFWGGYLTDKVGRYKMFLLDLVILIIAAAGTALCFNLPILYFFRFLLGFGVGLDFPVAFSFIAEYVTVKKRAGIVNIWQPVWFFAGSFVGVVLLPFYFFGSNNAYLWRVAVGFGAVPAFIILILRYKYMDESPMWAAHNLSLQEAGRILTKTYGVKVNLMPEERPELPKPRLDIRELLSAKYIKRTTLITLISIAATAESYAILFNFPSISMGIFGGGFLQAILGMIFLNLFGVIGGCGAVWKGDKIGTRKLSIIGFAIALLSLLTFWAGRSTLPLLLQAGCFGVFLFGHSLGAGSNGSTMATISFPTRMRGMAVGWVSSSNRVGSILGFYFFPLAIAWGGLRNMALLCAGFPLIGLIAALSIKWEPVGKDIEAEDVGFRRQEAADSAAAAASRGR